MCIQWLALPHRIGFIQAPAIDIDLAVFQVDGLTGRRDDTFDKDVNSVPRPRILEYDDVAWLQITSRLKGNLLRKYAVSIVDSIDPVGTTNGSITNARKRKTAATTAPMNVMNFRIFFRIEVIPVVMHFAFLLG